MPKKPSEFDSSGYINGYIKDKYDRINLLFPKGYKDAIKRRAAEKGISASQYITELIDRDMPVKGLHIDLDQK